MMFPEDMRFLAQQERYKDFLWQAERERLVRASKLAHNSAHNDNRKRLPPAYWLGVQLTRLGCILQQCSTTASCCTQVAQ